MSTTTETASTRITQAVTSWPGVTAGLGRRGEFGFRLGRRELGHLHGDRVFHGGFPKPVWHELFGQGRIDYHPVFPGKPGFASRQIVSDDDVRDVVAMIRINYERAVEKHGLPQAVAGLHALAPERLPFAPEVEARAFLLERDEGNVLIYSTTTLDQETARLEELGGVARHYLGHGHEALFPAASLDAPLFVHEAERASVEGAYRVRGTFSRRHELDGDLEVIPIPGHTRGSTAYLWDSGEHRVLFSADTVYLDEGEWVAAVLASSDRPAYLESLELIRELDFDVLAPWAATAGEAPIAMVGRDEARRRMEAVIARVRQGADR